MCRRSGCQAPCFTLVLTPLVPASPNPPLSWAHCKLVSLFCCPKRSELLLTAGPAVIPHRNGGMGGLRMRSGAGIPPVPLPPLPSLVLASVHTQEVVARPQALHLLSVPLLRLYPPNQLPFPPTPGPPPPPPPCLHGGTLMLVPVVEVDGEGQARPPLTLRPSRPRPPLHCGGRRGLAGVTGLAPPLLCRNGRLGGVHPPSNTPLPHSAPCRCRGMARRLCQGFAGR